MVSIQSIGIEVNLCTKNLSSFLSLFNRQTYAWLSRRGFELGTLEHYLEFDWCARLLAHHGRFHYLHINHSILGHNGIQQNRKKSVQMWKSSNNRGSFWMDDWGTFHLCCGSYRNCGKFHFNLHLFQAKSSSNISQSSSLSRTVWRCKYKKEFKHNFLRFSFNLSSLLKPMLFHLEL